MAIDCVISQLANLFDIAAGGEELECANPQVRGGDPRQDGTLFGPVLANHFFTGQRCGKRARGGNAQRMHRLAEQIFAQHRS